MRSKSSKFITIVVLGMVVVMSAIIPVHAVASGGSGKIQRRSVRLTNASKDLGLKLTKAEAAQKLTSGPPDLAQEVGKPFDYARQKVRGVNLGGWLVLEPWIKPSIFDKYGLTSGFVDEFTLTRGLGWGEATRVLKDHWETWITLVDLQQIKAYGLNHIRIPIGYWAVEPLAGDPYVQGQLPYLDRALEWARQVGLQVWVDLHGAPGSQNGFDNSGQRDRLDWQTTPGLVEHTVKVLGILSQRYARPEYEGVVAGIEVLNEPLGPRLDMNRVRSFMQDSYSKIQTSKTNPSIVTVIQDAFQPMLSWNGFMIPPQYQNVLLDIHHYQVFTPGLLQMTEQEHIAQACGVGWDLRGTDKWTVIGEWCGAFTDCTKWLNGYNTKSRYEGQFGGSPYIGNCGKKVSGKVADLPQAERDRIRKYIEAQLDAYEQGTGWIFWTWKTEGSPEWDMSDLLKQGVFPRPDNPGDRKWPRQCGY